MMATAGERIEEELEIALGLAAETVETAQRSSDLVVVMTGGRAVLRSRLRLTGGSDKEQLDHQLEVFKVVGRALRSADALILALDGRGRPPPDRTWPGQPVQSPALMQCVLAAALSRTGGGHDAELDTTYVVWSYRFDDDGKIQWHVQLVTRWGAQLLRKRRAFSPVFEAIAEGLGLPAVTAPQAEKMLVELGQRPFRSADSIVE
ncbi:MAG: hypothetical protein ACRDV9_07105 [Acidimicrobiia bacterium]